ncbi:MAG TPA: hypothetical protein VK493_04045 [Bryobacteraceae bacterium]|nr:hypothetical protein [Bryobacteraceae bacterium]
MQSTIFRFVEYCDSTVNRLGAARHRWEDFQLRLAQQAAEYIVL